MDQSLLLLAASICCYITGPVVTFARWTAFAYSGGDMRAFPLLLLAGTALGFNARLSATSSTFSNKLSQNGMTSQIRGTVMNAVSVDVER